MAFNWQPKFTQGDPFNQINWVKRDAKIGSSDGRIVFEQKNVEVPEFWSQTAIDIVVSKYFSGKKNSPERESSVKQLVNRVAKTISGWGFKDGYFDSPESAQNFENDLKWLLINQYASFNSPVWFNLGVVENPQLSACFILSVEDNMQSILHDWYSVEGMIFKGGSGSGINISNLRSSKESLSKGGVASGPVSFMQGADGVANSIKSGGRTRRAAKMVVLNADHPDIKNFIYCKRIMEEMSQALAQTGKYDTSIEGRLFSIYTTLPFQNANNSVRVTDEFMEKVLNDEMWDLKAVKGGETLEKVKAREILEWCADAAWHSADPGMQYDTTINKWHTLPNTSRINASNPCCITGDTLIAVADGRNAVPIKDLVGSETPVYSYNHRIGKTTVARMWNIGVKRQQAPIYEVLLDDGTTFRATDDHLIMLRDGSYRMVRDLKDKDSLMPFHSKILAPVKTRTKRRYYWTGGSWQPQYRAVWEYFNGKQPTETHIHHQDFSARNDLVDNLILLSIKEHQEIHRGNMLGDNNPARRLMNDNWRANIAEAVRGEKNGNFGNTHSEETRTKMRQQAALRWSKPEEHKKSSVSAAKWQAEAKAEGRRVGGIPGKRFERCCPICRENYLTARPEQIFCSLTCRYSPAGLQISGAKTASANRGRHLSDSHRARLSMILKIVSDPEIKRRAAKVAHRNHILRAARLLLDNNITPALENWDILAQQARELGAKRVPSSGIVKQYFPSNKKFVEAATLNNHKVVSVNFAGYEDVYDGTVDGHSNFAILTATTDSCVKGNSNYSGIFIHNSEYMSIDNSACNLGSINLLKFLDENGQYDIGLFKKAVDVIILAQDILVDNSSYPTEKITQNAKNFRQLGLGFANLGSLLMARGLPYDSDEGRTLAGTISALYNSEAYKFSSQIAKHKGPFNGYQTNREPMLNVIKMHRDEAYKIDENLVEQKELLKEAQRSWDEALAYGHEFGYRNSQVSVIAPTGTIAFMMDCDTTGIEPELALIKYKKLVGGGVLKLVNNQVPRALKKLSYNDKQIKEITDYIDKNDTIEGAPHIKNEDLAVFDCSFKAAKGLRTINYLGHLKMMGAVQPFVSGAISKTVNLPREATREEIFNAFIEAWKLGIKAVAFYRDGSKTVQPLNTEKEEKKIKLPKLIRRYLPNERPAIHHKFSIAGHEGYINVGLYPEDYKVGETFINMAKEGSTMAGLMDTIAVLTSVSLQYGIPLKVLVKKLKDMRFEPMGMTANKDIPFASSIVDYIFKYLGTKFLTNEEKVEVFGTLSVPNSHAQRDGSAALGNGPEIKINGQINGDAQNGKIETTPKNGLPNALNNNGLETIMAKFTEQKEEELDAQPALALSETPETTENPLCSRCGFIMYRAGTCMLCRNCGEITGVCS